MKNNKFKRIKSLATRVEESNFTFEDLFLLQIVKDYVRKDCILAMIERLDSQVECSPEDRQEIWKDYKFVDRTFTEDLKLKSLEVKDEDYITEQANKRTH